MSRDSPSGAASPDATPPPPVDFLVDVIFNMLSEHPNATTILARAAHRLGYSEIIWGPVPGLVTEPVQPILAIAFARWRTEAATKKRLQRAIVSFRPSPRSSAPPAPSPPSPSRYDDPETNNLLFQSADDLPAELRAVKDRAAIVQLISSRVDRTKQRWRTRSLYTPENYAEWAKWQNADQPHRDAIAVGGVLLQPDQILVAPDLRSPVIETAADAWNDYRRLLLGHLRQALVVGLSWPEILVRLSSTYSDSISGYPRLVNYVNNALEAEALLKYPLLHADLLIYQLDLSYSNGSLKYSYDSVTVDWERAFSRLPGEDPVTLAQRVTNAFLRKLNDPSINDVSVWSHSSLAHSINARYAECLLNDDSDPSRGILNHSEFMKAWARVKLDIACNKVTAEELSCERLAAYHIVTSETSGSYSGSYFISSSCAQPAESQRLQLQHQSHQTGAGARARRDAARAADRATDGLPPSAHMPDWIPE
jgi:hypothetical protein